MKKKIRSSRPMPKTEREASRLLNLERILNESTEVSNRNLLAIQKACQALEVRVEAVRLVINDMIASDVTVDPADNLRPYWVAYYHTALLTIKKLLADETSGGPQLLTPKQEEEEAPQEFGIQNGKS